MHLQLSSSKGVSYPSPVYAPVASFSLQKPEKW